MDGVTINNADYLLEDDDVQGTPVMEEESQNYVEPMRSEFVDPTDQVNEGVEPETEESFEEEGSVLDEFLKARGISDPSKIKFENEDGEIEERAFNDLSREEQQTILEQLTQPDISDYEASVINYMRQNNMSMEELMEAYAAEKVNAYAQQLNTAQPANYRIDDFTDEELYVADLRNKYRDFSDEEILAKLQKAEEDENLFKKEVSALRAEYKALEEQEMQASVQREQQEYEDLRNNLAQAVGSFNKFAIDYNDPESDALVLEDGDKQQMLSYILDQDSDGKSRLVKDLEDPNMLAEIALWRTKGAEFLAETTNYYKSELAKAHKEINRLKSQAEKSSSKSTVVKKIAPVHPFKDDGIRANYFDKLI